VSFLIWRVVQTAALVLQPSPSSPIIVNIIPPKEENLYDVLVSALGVTGVMVAVAFVAALVFGGVLFWVRSRAD
jgi:hypothetical protein